MEKWGYSMNNGTVAEDDSIAIIGMSCRFPKAKNIEEYWNNIVNGVESVVKFSKEDALKWGACLKETQNKNFIGAGGLLNDISMFDAEFFGYNDAEAQIMDPQQRLFLECAWEALEDAGHCKADGDLLTGVYASSSQNTYFIDNIIHNTKTMHNFSYTFLEELNNKDLMPSRLAYLMNFHGPCMAIQTGCVSFYMALYTAMQALLDYQIDSAVVGSSSIRLYVNKGYIYQEGGLLAPDGHCCPLDNNANGTVGGNGVGVVVLKRLKDALENKDNIYAIIRGIEVANDGNEKIGFHSPGFYGQVDTIQSAYDISKIDTKDIKYIEVQGAATSLGDTLELKALSKVFGLNNKKCYLGSVKANIGNLDVASGIAAFIKAALMAKYKLIPPQINYKTPNINLRDTCFDVNKEIINLGQQEESIKLAINGFGIGGNNVHIILESPQNNQLFYTEEDKNYIFPFSAYRESELEIILSNMLNYLMEKIDIRMCDLERSLQAREHNFKYRIVMIAKTRNELITLIRKKLGHIKQNQEIHESMCITSSQQANINLDRELQIVRGKNINQDIELILNALKVVGIQCNDLIIDYDEEKFNYYKKCLNKTFLFLGEFKLIDFEMDKDWIIVDSGKSIEIILGKLYCAGFSISWEARNQNTEGKIISLPLYPFMENSYWINADTIQNEEIKPSQESKDKLLNIFQSIIGKQNINNTMSMKEMGISSIIALQILARIQEEYNFTIEVDRFLQIGNIKELYNIIEKSELLLKEDKNDSIIFSQVRKGSTNQCIICFAPLNSLTSEYVKDLYNPLISRCDENISAYIMQLNLLSQHSFADYIKECKNIIENSVIEKDYVFIGWCSGGVFAVNIANMFTETGKEIKHVVLLDTYEPQYLKTLTTQKVYTINNISFPAYYIHSFLLQMDKKNKYFESNECLREINNMTSETISNFVNEKLSYLGYSEKLIDKMLQKNIILNIKTENMAQELLNQTYCQSYKGEVTIVNVQSYLDGEMDQYLGWKGILKGKVKLKHNNYTHDTMMLKTNVADIAAIIHNILEVSTYDN